MGIKATIAYWASLIISTMYVLFSKDWMVWMGLVWLAIAILQSFRED